MNRDQFIAGLPKSELHIHIEGSLSPEMMMSLAEKNGVALPYSSIEAVHEAYNFTDLQSFLDLYYLGASALVTEEDFYALMKTYLDICQHESIVHTEIMFDPQTHTDRGIDFAVMFNGYFEAIKEARREGVSVQLIMCFLRHLSEESAFTTLEQAEPFREQIQSIGLDSGEVGNPPEKFQRVFAEAGARGYRRVAHAGEEGPVSYIYGALETLNVERIDHGVRCVDDPALVQQLAEARLPLTVCPLSNVRLCVHDELSDSPIIKLLREGLCVTVNSDDPTYFGGFLNANYLALANAFDLTNEEVVRLAANSFEASFLTDDQIQEYQSQLSDYAASQT